MALALNLSEHVGDRNGDCEIHRVRSRDWIAETEVPATFDREPMKGWKPSVATTRASSAMKSRIVGRQGDRLATYRASSSEPVHPGSNRKARLSGAFLWSRRPVPGADTRRRRRNVIPR